MHAAMPFRELTLMNKWFFFFQESIQDGVLFQLFRGQRDTAGSVSESDEKGGVDLEQPHNSC